MPSLFAGIDAGGSKTKLLVRAADGDELTLIGPAANLQVTGVTGVAGIFSDLVRKALDAFPGASLGSVCAGVSGAGRPKDRAVLEAEWRRQLGDLAPAHLTVQHDAVIAVEGAFEGGSGVIVIVGTGSIAFAKTDDGALHRVGGWGYLLGDEGSGFIIGLEGLKAVAAAMDGGPPTRLQHLLAEHTGIRSPDELIHAVYQERGRAPQFAPHVVSAAQDGDPVAQEIIQTQLAQLAGQVRWLVNRCGPLDQRIALIGGLSQSPYIRAVLEQKLLAQLPGWGVGDPLHDPAVGALRLALAEAGDT